MINVSLSEDRNPREAETPAELIYYSQHQTLSLPSISILERFA